MAESPVATPHLREEAPSPTRSAAAPEAAAPEAATEVAAQALVRAFHPGASGGGAAGAPSPPPPPTWAARRSAGPRDFVALQRMAGNRAVAGMMARGAATPTAPRAAAPPATTPAIQRRATAPRPAPVVQRKPKGELVEASLDDIQINPPEPPKAYALQYASDSLDEAASSLSKDIKHPGDVLIIGLQAKLLIVYGKDGKRISPRFEVKLPPGVKPSPGVYLSPSAKDAEENNRSFPMRQINVDPTTEDWKLGGYVAFLKYEENKKKAGAADGAADVGAPDIAVKAAKAVAPPGTAATAAGGEKGSSGNGPGDATAPGAGDPTKGPKPLPLLNLRSYVKDAAGLDAVIDKHKDALQFYLVPSPKPGSGGKQGAGSTTGFAGEVEGKGPPPNRPPWPVSMDGPRMQPADSDGVFSARINWAANGNDSFSAQTISAIGTYIHYRWEMFDITAFAKKNQEKLAAQAAQTQAMVKAAEARGIAVDTPGSVAANAGDKPGAAKPTTPPPPPAADQEKSYDEQIEDLTRSKVGTGKDPTADTRNRAFRRSFEELGEDTGNAWQDLKNPSGSTMLERQSNAQANVIAIELLPVSFVITALGSSLRWFADLFAGERDNQEINFPHEGTFLVRVVTTPSVGTDREGNEIIRPSSVATRVVEVVKMDRMVKEGLDDPAAQLAQADLDLAQAIKSGNEERIKAAQAARDLKALETEGDPLKYIEAKLKIKKEELERVKKKYEGIAVGPIMEVEREIELLEHRKKVFLLQEGRRTEGDSTLAPPQRVNATLVSEVTGQTYPLLLSIGPAKKEGNRHVWKVLDATNEDAKGFTGYGATEWLAVNDAFRQFGQNAAYGRGLIGVRIPDTIPLGTDPIREFTVKSKPLGWAIARGRIDDLVMTLAALGLFVASAGTASIAIGAAVAAARLIDRLYNGTLRLDAAAVSDVLAILGAVGAAAHHAAEVSVKAASIKFQKIGDAMVMLEEGAAISGSELRAAEQAFEKASGFFNKIEKANEILNYAGVVWGNVTFFDTMAETALLEAKGPAAGGITHAEARRRRAAGLAGAINNNGMAIAPNAIKAMKARKAAKAAKTGAPSESVHPKGAAEQTPKPDTTPITPEPKPEPIDRKAPIGPDGPAAAGGEHGSDPTEAPKVPGEPAVKPGEHAPPTTKPAESGAPSGAPPLGHTAGGPGAAAGEPAAAPAKRGPRPGGVRERVAAHKALQDAARGQGDLKAAARDAIGKGGSWKESLKAAVEKLEGDHRVAAEKALVEARDGIVKEEWKKLEQKYPDLTMENTGTKAFDSDIDATIRPKAEATGAGPKIAEQVERSAQAAKELSEALRNAVGGETDHLIDTNIYSFIGEGRLASVDPRVTGPQAHVDIVTGLAEQLRGQGEAGFKAFEQSLGKKLGDPKAGAEAKALLAEARDFHGKRQAEWSKALADAGVPPKGKPTPEQARKARDAILDTKKGELGSLLRAEPANQPEITRKQAEINWFAPDAYATPSAFKQAVAHGQRLKGSARTAREWKASDVATKLRENAAKLAPDEPRAQKMKRDAMLVESQGNTLEAIEKDIRAAQDNAPVDVAKVRELEAYAEGLRKSIATTAEPLVVAEILGITTPADQPGPQRLSEAAAASAANMGMLEGHIKHTSDINEQVKAAAKYAGRVAMAEFLSGLRPSSDPVARLISEFVKGRWGIWESSKPQLMRDLFVRYGRATGRHTELTYNTRGEATGATDKLKQAFIDDVRNWARNSNAELQAAAIGSKAYDNPAVTPPPASGEAAPTTGEPPTRPPAGGDAGGGPGQQAGPAGEHGGGEPQAGEPEPAPRPSSPVAVTRAGGITTFAETPTLNPPGDHGAFAFRMESFGEASRTLRRIADGDPTALSERGVQLPPDYKTQGREFGMAALPDGTYAIVQGVKGLVLWHNLPVGSVPMMHTHPMSPERAISRPRTVTDLAKQAGKNGSNGPTAGAKDAVMVFPSASDTLFCAANGIRQHDVGTPYVHTGDGVLKNPTGAKGEKGVSFRISDAVHAGNMGERPISESFITAHDVDGNVLFMSRMWAMNFNGDSWLMFERPPMDPPKPETLPRSLPTKAGEITGKPDGSAPVPTGAGKQGRDAGPKRPQPRGESFGTWVPVEGLEGGAWIKDDGVATTVRAEADPTALVKVEGKGQALVLTDIYRQQLAQGTGSVLLAEALRAVKAGPGSEILIDRIENRETIAAHAADQAAAESKLGKTTERALAILGLAVRRMDWEKRGGRLRIVVDVG